MIKTGILNEPVKVTKECGKKGTTNSNAGTVQVIG